jgi:hypothetical protein
MGRQEPQWNGKRKPVTLVRTVVVRKSAVQPSSFSAVNIPNTTTNPEKIPIKLNTTCTNVSGVMPKIMMRILSREFWCSDPPHDGQLYCNHVDLTAQCNRYFAASLSSRHSLLRWF